MSSKLRLILVLIVLLVSGCYPPSPANQPATATTSAPLPVVSPAVLPPPTAAPSPVTSPSAVPPVATEPAPEPVPGATTYTSPLGISFKYLPDQNGQTIKVFEQGDRIYVYPATMEATKGQWVQVFQKPAGESLVDAVTRVIMPGYPQEDCRVVKTKDPLDPDRPGSSYDYAGIVVRRDPGENEETVFSRWRSCPNPYTVVGGIGYFQADPQHPDRFVFFSIGQYAILAGGDQPWQETVTFE